MILIGLDDTDVVDHPGTNQLARHIVRSLDGDFHGRMIVRHQLFFDPRVPYTSQNGSASIWLEPRHPWPQISELQLKISERFAHVIDRLRTLITDWCPAGSDPGFCVADHVPGEIVSYALRCQSELITQEEARSLAARCNIHLEGIGGTEGGVIGALAAVGLASVRESGRIVHLSPVKKDLYDVNGRLSVDELRGYGVETVLDAPRDKQIAHGEVEIRKRLRPNLQNGRIVLFVESATEPWFDGACYQTIKVV
jgi:hypothetical protein